jgi:hypothetical protein
MISFDDRLTYGYMIHSRDVNIYHICIAYMHMCMSCKYKNRIRLNGRIKSRDI